MTQDDLTNTLTAIAAKAGRIAGALDYHMRHERERDPVLHAMLHRLLGACLELERHTTQATQARAQFATSARQT